MRKIIMGLLICTSLCVVKIVDAAPNTLMTRADGNSSQLMWSKSDKTHTIRLINIMKTPKTIAELEAEAAANGDVYVHPAGMPAYTGEHWDVSQDQDGSVMAYWYKGGSQPEIIGEETVIVSLDLLEIQFNGKLFTPEDSSFLFANFNHLRQILNIEHFDTSLTKNMSHMFFGCDKLWRLDLSNFDTSKVTNMFSLFNNCKRMDSLNLSGFNTSNVTSMSSMFSDCQSLTQLNLSDFDTSKVTNMQMMFNNCYLLTELNISSFNTANVKDMGAMFKNCRSLNNIDAKKINTSEVTNMSSMFEGVSTIEDLDLSSLNTTNVTNMEKMFANTTKLTQLYLNLMTFDKVTSSNEMFKESNPNITITVKDQNAKQFIKNKTSLLNVPDEKIVVLNTSVDNPSSSSSSSSAADTSSSSTTSKSPGSVDNPKTGVLSLGIILSLFIIISSLYILVKKDKLYKQI